MHDIYHNGALTLKRRTAVDSRTPAVSAPPHPASEGSKANKPPPTCNCFGCRWCLLRVFASLSLDSNGKYGLLHSRNCPPMDWNGPHSSQTRRRPISSQALLNEFHDAARMDKHEKSDSASLGPDGGRTVRAWKGDPCVRWGFWLATS